VPGLDFWIIEISKGRLFLDFQKFEGSNRIGLKDSRSFKMNLIGRKLYIIHSDPGPEFTINTGLKATRFTSFKQ